MDKQAAAKIIGDTFENPFDKARFVHFIKNLLNNIDETKAFPAHGVYITESFREYVRAYERIGTYTDPAYPQNNKIDVLIVYLRKETSLERARTSQRNFVARYLKDRGQKEAGLIAFVSPDPADWRFSLVKMEYKLAETPTGKVKVKEEFTPARRWSFLVGENESSHTAQSQLVGILADDKNNPTLFALEGAFNIEVATREFFNSYRELFNKVKEKLDNLVATDNIISREFDNRGIDAVNFAKKLLGQIVFLYFLQKKGWLGVPENKNWGDGDKKFLRNLFEKSQQERRDFFNDYLEYLFYDALNKQDRGGVDPSYYQRFDCRIPFLNGGLFNSDYDWVKTDIVIPNDIFSNRKNVGDEGSGIIDVFDLYNFTVKEDEPLEKEVAVDPEMLGKVFENLLEVKDRKSKGTYYTPREIVHYMCQESLINYLDTAVNTSDVPLVQARPPQGKLFGQPDPAQATLKIPGYRAVIPRGDIEDFVRKGEFTLEHDSRVVKHGSETERYSYQLPETIRHNAKLVDEKLANIRVCDPAIGSGAFPVGMMHEIVKARSVLTTHLDGEAGRTPYAFKRHAIQNCLYGVDIDPGAVEIAKLRLWLSLVVDEEDITHIKPLPNLDYKIVCGNSLLGFPFKSQRLTAIEQLKQQFFDETDHEKKAKLKSQVDQQLREAFAASKKSLGYEVNFDFEIYFSEVFHGKGGFDVVIANPPYIEHKKLKEVSSVLKNDYEAYSGTADIYVYFYEKGLKHLRDNGILAFISSNKFLKTSYGAKLRGLLTRHNVRQIIDFTQVHVFDALVATCIVVVSKGKDRSEVLVSFADDRIVDFAHLYDFVDRNHLQVSPQNLDASIWQLEDSQKLTLKSKIESGCKKLSDIQSIHIYRGVTTGCNEAFVVDEAISRLLVTADPKNKDIIKPLLHGRNIKRWGYEESKEFLIFTRKGITIKNYPAIEKYLLRFRGKLEPGKGRKPGSYNWYEVQDNTAYYPEFEKEKIIWGLTADKWAFAYDDKGHYLPSNGYILTSSKISIKYLLALLNSNLMKFYFNFIGIMTAGGAFTLKHETIGEFPIKEGLIKDQQPFIDLIDQILEITKDEDYLTNAAKQARVKEYERQIDQMVYELYELTPEEIVVVEGQS